MREVRQWETDRLPQRQIQLELRGGREKVFLFRREITVR
jgi:hypothetical protein